MTGSSSAPLVPAPAPAPGDRLDSWKEIAAYFNRDKRTVQRWERQEGMPVYRHQHDKQGTVYAAKAELDEWWKGRRARIEREEHEKKTNILNWPIPADAIRTPMPAGVAARYEVLAEIGSGGMGVVYKARDRETGEVVALKVLRVELANDPVWMERFKEELRLARRVTHRNVCRIHEFVRTEDCAYISMEFVDGDSLREILNRFGALNARTCVTVTRQICAGLQEAHAQGVIHRDLKPENVMLDRTGQIKLMDFGIASSPQAQEERDTRILGTPAYMAPEQTEGNTVDVRSDIYAVGLILYEMTTGRPAFSGNTPVEIALKQVREAPTAPRTLEPGIPERIEKAILRALSKTPQERFQSADEFAQSLAADSESLPTLEAAQTEALLEPVQAAHWQKVDWLLLACGILGAILLSVLGGRALPYRIYRLELSRSEAIAKAESLVRAYAPELRHGEYAARFDAGLQLLGLPKLAARKGASATLEQTRLHAHSWSVSHNNSGRPEDAFSLASSRFDFDVQGNLTFLRFARSAAKENDPPENPEAMRRQAAKYAEDVFDLQLDASAASELHDDPQSATWIRTSGERVSSPAQGATPVEWSWRNTAGQEEGARIWLLGDRLAAAERIRSGDELPLMADEERPHLYRYFSQASSGILFLGLVALAIAKRLFLRRAPAVIVAAACLGVAMAAALGTSHQQDGPTLNGYSGPGYLSETGWGMFLFGWVIVGVTFFFILLTPYHLTKEACPEHVSSLDAVTRGDCRARRVGLAVLRGVLFGGALLGIYALLVDVFGRHGIVAFGTLPSDILSGSATEAFVKGVARSLSGPILDTWISVLVPFALVYRFTNKPWLAIASAGAFALLTGSGLDGMELLPTVPYFCWVAGQMLLLATVFWLTDLLTCMVAVFTVETFLLTYTVMQIYGRTEPWVQRWGLVPWAVMALAGLILWSKPQIYAGFRRISAAFG
jgi:tRNA A-37 threonylcarbamoyl transferase component Bud32